MKTTIFVLVFSVSLFEIKSQFHELNNLYNDLPQNIQFAATGWSPADSQYQEQYRPQWEQQQRQTRQLQRPNAARPKIERQPQPQRPPQTLQQPHQHRQSQPQRQVQPQRVKQPQRQHQSQRVPQRVPQPQRPPQTQPQLPAQAPRIGDGGNWYGPHRPQPTHYRDFAAVFNDIDRRAEPEGFNTAAENDDMNDDYHGRSIVAPGQYPHMAALGFRTGVHRETEFKCGGSLISEYFVLTAAHCCYINGQTPDIIKIGDIRLKEFENDNRPQRRRVEHIYLHPYYNSSYHYNDIALILLNRPIEYSHFVRPIRLWAADEIPYDKVHTMGYGSTSFASAPTNVLTELDLSIVPFQQCNSTMPADENAPYGLLDSQICAKDYERNRDTCQGDSGGPLQLNLERRRRHRRYRYYLVGITSYGAFCRSSYPGVYTRVSSYIDWIASIVWPNYFDFNFRK